MYELGPDNAWIRCLICNRISPHPADIEQRFCGHCMRFHEDALALGRQNLVEALCHIRPDLGVEEQAQLIQKILDDCKPARWQPKPQWSEAFIG